MSCRGCCFANNLPDEKYLDWNLAAGGKTFDLWLSIILKPNGHRGLKSEPTLVMFSMKDITFFCHQRCVMGGQSKKGTVFAVFPSGDPLQSTSFLLSSHRIKSRKWRQPSQKGKGPTHTIHTQHAIEIHFAAWTNTFKENITFNFLGQPIPRRVRRTHITRNRNTTLRINFAAWTNT